jgi:hypothetical protein
VNVSLAGERAESDACTVARIDTGWARLKTKWLAA